MNIRFDGATVVVTGAAHGFGREIARRFAGLGARVWGCDVLADELEETRALCGAGCEVRVVDVTDRAAVRAFIAEAEEGPPGRSGADGAAGRGVIDVLVNNAGGVLGQVGKPVEEVDPEEWQRIFDVNTTGAFYTAQAVARGMKRAGKGRIVNISSGAGLGVSLTGIQAYASAKAAQIGLTRQLAHELGPFGITVNNVAPGFVRSNPTTERQWQSYGEEGQRALVEGIPLRRLGTVGDIAGAVLFLASEHAGWITGEVLRVSGGR
jgi:3-oxoacyl-[acyl-carrier protein] reductase